ncbi:MAG: DUF1244 domain-containing protein [Alphaproteobacteria bacterium]|uniref:DUF1244 domain-containing protein n=1 Tax=Aestuariivirga sp. TaxID=2650926 RepID=UPI003017C18A|nr:DUF1244 domain-containing protein [Alphaproteobacteria bacterium]
MNIDDKTKTELEAAAFRRLLEHLRGRTDVQNIDMMNLAGFCRNCLSNWFEDAAKAKGVAVTREEARSMVYGMPYDEWKAKHQAAASDDQKAAFAQSQKH